MQPICFLFIYLFPPSWKSWISTSWLLVDEQLVLQNQWSAIKILANAQHYMIQLYYMFQV